jgi:hypothetical protein
MRKIFLALVLAVPLALAACDSDPASAGQLSVSLVSPANGATISAPFTVKLRSSVPLGPTDSGKHHVHIYFDDHADDYTIVESDTAQITSAPAGEHTLHASLRNANHSPAGAEATVKVMVGSSTSTDTPEPKGPGGY